MGVVALLGGVGLKKQGEWRVWENTMANGPGSRQIDQPSVASV
jgi:hypothetical protein